MPQLRPVSPLADIVAGEIEKRILEGSLKPGDVLPAEREFALDLGVSRPSLREGIKKLVSKGLLITRHGLGTIVTDHLDACFIDPWQSMLKSNPALHRDMLEFRQILESEAAALAAERALDVDIVRLDAAYEALDAAYASNDVQACVDRDLEFHQAIAESAHNVFIGHQAASLMRVIHGHIAINLEFLHVQPQRWALLRDQHRAIWDAIRRHQPEEAARAARNHVEFVRQSMDDNAVTEIRRTSALRRLGESIDQA